MGGGHLYVISAAIAALPTLESAWVDNLQCSSHTLAEDNLAYVTKGTRELQRQTNHVILQQRDSQQSQAIVFCNHVGESVP